MSIKRETAAERKALPLASGVLDYFPDALLAVAEVSRIGNEQHHPGEPLHWDKSKSTDEADALMRHLLDRGTRDTDGGRHSAKVAWRALAMLQREIDAETPVETVRSADVMDIVASEFPDHAAMSVDERRIGWKVHGACNSCGVMKGMAHLRYCTYKNQ